MYAIKIRESLVALDTSATITGWIVDIRENIGGLRTMMPLGLAPLFQDSLIGYSINNKKEYFEEYCTSRYFYSVDKKVDSIAIETELRNESRVIAVLIGPNTVSSGEYLASVLRFQPSTKLFGSPTRGKTSGLELFVFNSGAKLLLATVYMGDKNMEMIESRIFPDVVCEPDQSLILALDWLNGTHY